MVFHSPGPGVGFLCIEDTLMHTPLSHFPLLQNMLGELVRGVIVAWWYVKELSFFCVCVFSLILLLHI